MNIIGVLLFFLMPYVAGSLIKIVTKQKETNQIETYLIGFFFLFFLQGVVFVPAVFGGSSFESACNILYGAGIFLLASFLILWMISLIRSFKRKEKEEFFRNWLIKPFTGQSAGKWHKEELFMAAVAIFVILFVALRIISNVDVMRRDALLETVVTTVQTKTMFFYHPLTGRIMESGMIASKKMITLPLFYAFLCDLSGISPNWLVNVWISLLVIVTSCFSAELLFCFFHGKGRRNIFAFRTIYGLLVLSGGYGLVTPGYMLLYQSYAGSSICAFVFVPYLLLIICRWYRMENREENVTAWKRIRYVIQIFFLLLTSMFITGIASGLLFLIIALIMASLCCLFKTIKEVRECA